MEIWGKLRSFFLQEFKSHYCIKILLRISKQLSLTVLKRRTGFIMRAMRNNRNKWSQLNLKTLLRILKKRMKIRSNELARDWSSLVSWFETLFLKRRTSATKRWLSSFSMMILREKPSILHVAKKTTKKTSTSREEFMMLSMF